MTAIERTIVDANSWVHPDGVDRWTIMTVNPDGSLFGYILPVEGFANHAAEYGIDPADLDTLLRLCMLQLHIPAGHHLAAIDAAIAQARAAQGKPTLVRTTAAGLPVTLFTATSTEQARQAHFARLDYVEQHLVRIVQPTPGVRRTLATVSLAGDGVEPIVQDVDAKTRLDTLKQVFQPDLDTYAARRAELAEQLGRPV
ncbi:hypothetical protein [Nonomuraea basaltis]|uniref:hypothetical protein n=1 Tax=Nonomuraea basaltis TaxID=2495887 RepID=UPI00110C467B|nr:hypothetical protein [Nonomuraea basaltis]TMR99506.1 hypothetical protein EJK15_06750 [Nonomuraea basaltis]